MDEIGTEIYTLDVISPKRLSKLAVDSNIEIGKGYFITSDYNKNSIIKTIENLIDKESSNVDRNSVFDNISVYFRNQM